MENNEERQSVVGKVKAKLDKAQRIFLITNVLMTLIFAANSVIGMISEWGAGVIQYVTIALLAAYIIAFIVLIVLFNKDKKNLNDNMKNYKFAIKVMKNIVNLMNLALALSVMVEAITIDHGPKQIFAFIVAVLGIMMAVFKFIMLIFKFIRKKKKAAAKAAKKQARAEARAERGAKIGALLSGKGSADVDSEVAADTEPVDEARE